MRLPGIYHLFGPVGRGVVALLVVVTTLVVGNVRYRASRVRWKYLGDPEGAPRLYGAPTYAAWLTKKGRVYRWIATGGGDPLDRG